jgi:carbonic anhydrase/acetyltransferase-like protein (isoleucine patch superfamily)
MQSNTPSARAASRLPASVRPVFPLALKRHLVPVYHLAIPGCAFVAAAAPVMLAPTTAAMLAALFVAPALFAVAYVTVAGLLSLPHQRSIVPGKFPRSLSHPVYLDRRLYGLCLTAVYYCTPVYAAVLYVDPFRRYFFRLFGYRGDLDFTIHPDTWIRDLPLVRFGKGTYVANQATVGTNIVTDQGRSIWVDRIEVGAGSVIGSHTLVAPGTVIGSGVEIGINSICGLKARIRDGATLGPQCAVGHGAVIGENASLGRRAEVDSRMRVEAGTSVPPFARITRVGAPGADRDVVTEATSPTA